MGRTTCGRCGMLTNGGQAVTVTIVGATGSEDHLHLCAACYGALEHWLAPTHPLPASPMRWLRWIQPPLHGA